MAVESEKEEPENEINEIIWLSKQEPDIKGER